MSFLPSEIIKKKRNKLALTEEEISFFILGYTRGEIPEYQMSALLMAIYFNGMTSEETLALTKTMLNSGEVVKFNSSSFKVDKHSTGGVGDKTSLILGPIVAAAGIPVPMISGRGLGHTGGTLDKLESIPGFNVQLSLQQFVEAVEKHKICFIGQTKEICPADKKIYALRDVTATVESLPLICASIMSKKLAEGIDGLVLDVKFGSGAFMKTKEDCENLAVNLMKIAQGYGKKVVGVLSNMNQPLGAYAGNSLEVYECVEIMKNKTKMGPDGYDMYADTRELSLVLSAHMIHLAGVKSTFDASYILAHEILMTGRALAKFEELCGLHSGKLSELPMPTKSLKVISTKDGFVESFNTEKIGIACIHLKAGRAKNDDIILPTSGVEFHKKIGDPIKAGEAIFTIWGNNEEHFSQAVNSLNEAFKISLQKVNPESLIFKTLT